MIDGGGVAETAATIAEQPVPAKPAEPITAAEIKRPAKSAATESTAVTTEFAATAKAERTESTRPEKQRAAKTAATANIGRKARRRETGKTKRTEPASRRRANDAGRGEAFVGRAKRQRTGSAMETAGQTGKREPAHQGLVTGFSVILH